MLKSALVMTTAVEIAFAGLGMQPAAAAPQAPVIAKGVSKSASKSGAHDFSAARKKRRHHGGGFPIGAVGAIIGTIAGIAAAEQQREYVAVPYYGGPYVEPDSGAYYEEPYVDPGYAGPDVYGRPGVVHRRPFVGPRASHRPFLGHVGGARQFARQPLVRAQGFARPHGFARPPGGGRVGAASHRRH